MLPLPAPLNVAISPVPGTGEALQLAVFVQAADALPDQVPLVAKTDCDRSSVTKAASKAARWFVKREVVMRRFMVLMGLSGQLWIGPVDGVRGIFIFTIRLDLGLPKINSTCLPASIPRSSGFEPGHGQAAPVACTAEQMAPAMVSMASTLKQIPSAPPVPGWNPSAMNT